MKTHTYYLTRLFSLLLFVGMAGATKAQTYSEQREEGKSFKLKPGAVVQISNKYGNVNVLPWEKDSVRIEVIMSAQSKQAAKVVKILSSIDVEMLATATSVSARTVFYDNSATFWKDVVSYAGQVINTSSNLQISYTVYMPVTNEISIDNKFGNIYMDSHRAKANISVSNGDLQARNFSSGLKLKIEFGSASIQDAENMQLTSNYSDVSIRNVKSITLNSKSSTIEIEQCEALDITSSRDKLLIKSCNTLSGDASFSKIRITELEAVTSMTTKYGELKLNSVSRNFRTIQIKSEFTDIFLGVNPASGYSIDLQYDSKTSLNISSQINNQLKKETINPKLGTIQATGEIGKSGTAHISVTARAGALSMLNK